MELKGKSLLKRLREIVSLSGLHISRQDSSTNTVLNVLILRRSTTGTAADGIGGALAFETVDNAGAAWTQAAIEAIASNVAGAQADADLVGYTARNKTNAEAFRYKENGRYIHTMRSAFGTPGTTAIAGQLKGSTYTDQTNSGTVSDVPRFWEWGQWTLSAANAVTYDDVAMVVIGRPVAGTNVTFTRVWALWLDGRFNVDDSQDVTYGDVNKASIHTGGGISANKAIWARGELALSEMTAPSGSDGIAKIYAVDNGSGKTKLMVQFGSGAAQQIAIEP